MTDAVHRILDIVARVAPLDASRGEAEALLRRELGGQQLRIEERPPLDMSKVDALLRQRVPVREIADGLGVHRATIYRHLTPKSRRAR